MRAIRDAFRAYETRRCKSKNRQARCVFCPSPGADSLILDCDRIKGRLNIPGAMSDCIVIACHGSLHVAVVEIKGRRYSTSHAMSQLAAGADLALGMIDRAGLPARPRLHLVLVAPGHTYDQVAALASRRLRVRGKMMRIHAVRCGARLLQVIACA